MGMKKEGAARSEDDVSGKILVILVVILILVSILGTWTILTAMNVVKQIQNQPAIQPSITETQGQVIVTVLPRDDSKANRGGGG